MSASIDKEDATDGEGGAREVLTSWLEAHAAGECDTPTMQSRFIAVCRRHPDAPWDALALLDQYQRRGKLEPDVGQVLKREIAQMVFGTPAEATPHGREEHRAPASSERFQSRPPASREPQVVEEAEDDEAERDEDDDEEDEALPAAVPPRPRKVRTPEPLHVAFRAERKPPDVLPSQDVPRTLRGRYELQEVLGRGTDGVVYRALDRNREQLPESQRYVAIKLLNAERPLTGSSLAEYQRRAHQAQQLANAHLARVLDFDHDGGQHFLVVECVVGQLLGALLERGSLPREQAQRVISHVGEALVHAHGHGVVLGNLTPRKIVVASSGEAKLIDVGFPPTATELGQAAAPEHAYAARYASAERISGEPLSTNDDVYSFACILYELLTRRHPYDGRSGAAARVHQLRPEPINELSRSAWIALERGLRASRAERDITVMQLVTALTNGDIATADTAPDLAIRAPRRQLAEKPRSHAAVWLIAVLLVALAGLAAWWWLPPAGQGVRDRLEAMQEATRDMREPPVPSPPTDSARTLGSGQIIPAQPAGTATGPSAFEAATQNQATEAVPPASDMPTSPAPSTAGSSAVGGTQAGIIGFPKDTYVVRESDIVVRIPVVRTRGTRGEVSFRWHIERNSAEPSSDFGAVGPAQEFMAAGQSSTVLHIPLVSDSVREGTEMFMVQIDETAGGAQLGELARAAVIVVDDD